MPAGAAGKLSHVLREAGLNSNKAPQDVLQEGDGQYLSEPMWHEYSITNSDSCLREQIFCSEPPVMEHASTLEFIAASGQFRCLAGISPWGQRIIKHISPEVLQCYPLLHLQDDCDDRPSNWPIRRIWARIRVRVNGRRACVEWHLAPPGFDMNSGPYEHHRDPAKTKWADR